MGFGDDAESARFADAWLSRLIESDADVMLVHRLGERVDVGGFVHAHGFDEVLARAAAGLPTLLLGVHLGPYPIPVAIFDRLEIPFTTIAHPSSLAKLRPRGKSAGTSTMLALDEPGLATRLVRVLRGGGLVVSYVDAPREGRLSGGDRAPFLGRPTVVPADIDRLANATGAEIYSWTATSEVDTAGRRHVRLEVVPAGRRFARPGLGRALLGWAEGEILRNPEAWTLWRFWA